MFKTFSTCGIRQIEHWSNDCRRNLGFSSLILIEEWRKKLALIYAHELNIILLQFMRLECDNV